MKFEWCMTVGGTQHGQLVELPKGDKERRVQVRSDGKTVTELYERVVSSAGTPYLVYRPGRE